MADNTVIIYDPSGNPEKHTRPNARDLVVGAGYTWTRFVPANPAGYAPFATVTPPEGPAPSQRVLDRATGKEDPSAPTGAAGQAAAALQQQQAAMAAAIAQQQALDAAASQAAAAAHAQAQADAIAKAQAAAAAAASLPVPEVKDFSAAPAVDASDLDNDEGADAEDAGVTVSKTPRRGGRKAK